MVKLEHLFQRGHLIETLLKKLIKIHCFFYGNNYSQAGQDGIIKKTFYRLNITSGYFIEFGGWDGIYLSNCRSLYERGFKAIFIEQDKKRLKQ